jgi:hypothetical protein
MDCNGLETGSTRPELDPARRAWHLGGWLSFPFPVAVQRSLEVQFPPLVMLLVVPMVWRPGSFFLSMICMLVPHPPYFLCLHYFHFDGGGGGHQVGVPLRTVPHDNLALIRVRRPVCDRQAPRSGNLPPLGLSPPELDRSIANTAAFRASGSVGHASTTEPRSGSKSASVDAARWQSADREGGEFRKHSLELLVRKSSRRF